MGYRGKAENNTINVIGAIFAYPARARDIGPPSGDPKGLGGQKIEKKIAFEA